VQLGAPQALVACVQINSLLAISLLHSKAQNLFIERIQVPAGIDGTLSVISDDLKQIAFIGQPTAMESRRAP
jgi:hypothetical protein